MLPIAGQTARPIGLKFYVDTQLVHNKQGKEFKFKERETKYFAF